MNLTEDLGSKGAVVEWGLSAKKDFKIPPEQNQAVSQVAL